MNTLDEKTLTPNELDKKEEIVKSLKKKKVDFVKRYGADRAKSVMYATATKVAKEVTEETADYKFYKEVQYMHLVETGELLTLNQIKESDSLIDGASAGPIARASAKHGRIKPMSGTKTIATKIATILAKKV